MQTDFLYRQPGKISFNKRCLLSSSKLQSCLYIRPWCEMTILLSCLSQGWSSMLYSFESINVEYNLVLNLYLSNTSFVQSEILPSRVKAACYTVWIYNCRIQESFTALCCSVDNKLSVISHDTAMCHIHRWGDMLRCPDEFCPLMLSSLEYPQCRVSLIGVANKDLLTISSIIPNYLAWSYLLLDFSCRNYAFLLFSV